jgi:hypothetical protein
MNRRAPLFLLLAAALVVSLSGCVAPTDYSNFRLHPPRSIVVLPPLNRSTSVQGTYGYLSTVTRPLAEMGYYVFPVSVVDEFLKENGMPTAGEMQQAPVNKFYEIMGADAVLYVTLEQYGTKYEVITSATTVQVSAKLVDTRTGMILWQGTGEAQESSGSGDPLADLIDAALTQIINSTHDEAHVISRDANMSLLSTKGHGLLFGPYSPQYGKDK